MLIILKLEYFFGGRNDNNMTQTGWVDIDLNNKLFIEVSEDPVISFGEIGSFDDSLALGCSLVEDEDKLYFYYVGWMQGKRVRYYPSLGLSISTDGGRTFEKISKAPIIPRSDQDPFGMASPFVMKDGGQWRMWYSSYREWKLKDNEPWPRYELRYAESKDGIKWDLKNHVCIGSNEGEAVARPWSIKGLKT